MSDFMLPDIGEGIVECEVVEWRVAEGDRIEEDQPIVEVMTDKALVEITAPEAGVVSKLYVEQGQIAKVHAPLYAYQAEGEVTIETNASKDEQVAPQASQASSTGKPAEVPASGLSTPVKGHGKCLPARRSEGWCGNITSVWRRFQAAVKRVGYSRKTYWRT